MISLNELSESRCWRLLLIEFVVTCEAMVSRFDFRLGHIEYKHMARLQNVRLFIKGIRLLLYVLVIVFLHVI